MQADELALVGFADGGLPVAEVGGFADFRHFTEDVLDVAADGVGFFVGEVGVEGFVVGGNWRQGADLIAAVAVRRNGRIGDFVVFVVNFADDFFDDVFDGNKAGEVAVFVDNERHVVTVGFEVAQHRVQRFAFGDNGRRAQEGADVGGQFATEGVGQEVFGEEDAADLFVGFIDDGVARVAGFDDDVKDLFEAPGFFDEQDLTARDHDVAHAGVAEGGEACEHLRGFFANVAVGACLCDEFVKGGVKVGFFVVAPQRSKAAEERGLGFRVFFAHG